MAAKKGRAKARKTNRKAQIEARYRDLDKVVLKFRDALSVRLRGGAFTDLASRPRLSKEAAALTEEFKDARWLRVHMVDESKLDAMRALARKNTGKPQSDLNNQYVAFFADKPRAAELLKRLAGLADVEYAHYARLPVPPPTPPDFTASNSTGRTQAYLGPASSNGVDAVFAWTAGGAGDGVTICDVEYSWNFDHIELQGMELVGPNPIDPFNADAHGTAVAGVFGGRNDGIGVKGIAFAARRLAATVFAGWYNISAAITNGTDHMGAGDVILIEQHIRGPNTSGNVVTNITGTNQTGLVAVEWDRGVWETIRQATGAGFVVVEAAGNGAEDLDSEDYVERHWWNNETHAPFRSGNDSGAIIVGAGGSGDRIRASFSNFGSRVDVQGWGDMVVTSAGSEYDGSNDADLWSSDGINSWYMGTFAGTSSAAAMLGGVCASLQSAFRTILGRPATSQELRRILRDTGRPQGGSGGRIGPLPDLRAAIQYLRAQKPPIPLVHPDSGEHPLPLTVSIAWGDWQNFDSTRNPAIWTTIDGTRPEEGGGTSRRLCSGYACRDGTTMRFDQSGIFALRVACFMDSAFDGTRRRTDVMRPYQLYLPQEGPANLRATQGTDAGGVRLSWDEVPDALSYEIYTGFGGNPNQRLGEVNRDVRSFLHADAVGDGSQYEYWVRAKVEPRHRITQFSGPVIGWRQLGVIEVHATTRKFQLRRKIHVSWTMAPWPHFGNMIEYHLYRSPTSQKKRSHRIFIAQRTITWYDWNGRQLPQFHYPALEYDDTDVVVDHNYYYWVKVIDQNLGLPPTWGGPAIGRASA